MNHACFISAPLYTLYHKVIWAAGERVEKDRIQDKLDKLKTRKKGEPNPFVVGQGNYQKFLDVKAACTDVNIARRKEI